MFRELIDVAVNTLLEFCQFSPCFIASFTHRFLDLKTMTRYHSCYLQPGIYSVVHLRFFVFCFTQNLTMLLLIKMKQWIKFPKRIFSILLISLKKPFTAHFSFSATAVCFLFKDENFYEAVYKLEYLDAVFNESLRMYPPAWQYDLIGLTFIA